MPWIKAVSYENSKGKLRKLYDRISGKNNYLDNILTIHGLRPHSLEGHMSLYKAVLHHLDNQIAKWFLECIGVYVSTLNNCDYCRDHHYAGMKQLLNDESKSRLVYKAIQNDLFETIFNKNEIAVLAYCKKLTKDPASVSSSDIQILKKYGYDDGEILEINQVVSYFSYANRTVLGLGVTTDGDILGLSPSDSSDPNNWNHGHAKE